MGARRIHITGASGAGVTSLGRALAQALAAPHHDTDDYFWTPTDPPYRDRRPSAARLALMGEMFLARPDWVLSGALEGWGDALAPLFDLVVFVQTPGAIRQGRLRAREAARYGAQAVAPGGWRHRETEDFLAWAARYDDDSFDGRSRLRHEAWLARIGRPALRLDGALPLDVLTRETLNRIGA